MGHFQIKFVLFLPQKETIKTPCKRLQRHIHYLQMFAIPSIAQYTLPMKRGVFTKKNKQKKQKHAYNSQSVKASVILYASHAAPGHQIALFVMLLSASGSSISMLLLHDVFFTRYFHILKFSNSQMSNSSTPSLDGEGQITFLMSYAGQRIHVKNK